MRALSLMDEAAPIDRPDHGTETHPQYPMSAALTHFPPEFAGSTGSYDAWPALSFDAFASLDNGFSTATPFLVNMAGATLEGPYGQAKAINDADLRVFKTSKGFTRYTANNGAAFGESMLVTLFGYIPTWNASAAVLPTPAFAGQDRGVRGSLWGVRLPGSSPHHPVPIDLTPSHMF